MLIGMATRPARHPSGPPAFRIFGSKVAAWTGRAAWLVSATTGGLALRLSFSLSLGLVVGLAVWGCGERVATPGAPIEVRATLGEVGSSPGQFSYPRAMDAQVDDDGEWLWVIDKLGRVQKIDAQTGACAAWWRMPEIVLGKPTGVTVGPAAGPGVSDADRGRDVLWTVDTHYHQVLLYDPLDIGPSTREAHEPRVLARFGSFGEEPGQFVYPTDVALLRDARGRVERIYVTEYGGNDRITCLDAEFNVLFTFGEFGSSASPDQIEFNRPQSIGIEAGRGELVIADACNHRIGRFTLDGALIAWIGSPETAGSGAGQFRYPWGLYLPGDGTALVVEQQGARVQHIDLGTGESLGLYGRAGFGPGELVTPWAITMIGTRAYVLDSGNNRIFGFDGPRRRAVPRVAVGSGGHGAGGGSP